MRYLRRSSTVNTPSTAGTAASSAPRRASPAAVVARASPVGLFLLGVVARWEGSSIFAAEVNAAATVVEGVEGFLVAVRFFDAAFCLLRIRVLKRCPVTSVADTAPPPSSKVHHATRPLLLVLLTFPAAVASPLSVVGRVSVSRSKSLCMLSTISIELR